MRLKMRSTLTLVCVMMLASLLAACGDPTATTVPATTAAPTTAAATTAATTAAAITTAATTVAATTAATTVAATTVATTAAAASGTFPAISGVKEVVMDAAIQAEIAKQFPASLKNANIKYYTSDNDYDKAASDVDAALTGAGYKFAIPGQSKPAKQGEQYVGLYTKTGAEDLLIGTLPVPANLDQVGGSSTLPGLSGDALKKFADQMKGKKSLVFVLSAPNLLQTLFELGQSNGNPTTSAAQTTAAVTTAATAATGATTGTDSQLVGQLIAAGDLDIRIKKVERFTELKGTTKTATPKGVFLAITYEFANLGKKPTGFSFLTLKDGLNREFQTTTDFDAISALTGSYGYKSNFAVNPGFLGSEFKVYDVPKDATGFKLEADKTFGKTDRKPSADSFSSSGGKGADSGAGQELVGKTLTNAKEMYDVKVTKVERLTEIVGNSKSVKTTGVYLIVVFEATNNGAKPLNFVSMDLKDNTGRVFSGGTDFDVAIALSGKYKSLSGVNPGQSGSGYRAYEVTKDAAGMELTANA